MSRPKATRDRAKKATGRPPIEIDLKVLRAVCKISPNLDEIAAALEVSVRTLQRRLSDLPEMRELIESSRARLRFMTRRAVVAAVRRVGDGDSRPGDSTLVLFHAKQREDCGGLAYRDKHEIDHGMGETWVDFMERQAAGQGEGGGDAGDQ